MQLKNSDAKYLVFSSVGDRNNVHSWLSNSVQKNFDLVLYYFGDQEDIEFPSALLVKRKGLKFENFYHFLSHNDLSHYDAVWVVDDDIVMDTEAINKMFCVFSKFNLWLAQPSYSQESQIRWEITQNNSACVIRYTNFVENGVALFATKILPQLITTFKDACTGCGVDLIWPILLNFPKDKIAVIDAITCCHPATNHSSLDEAVPRRLHLVQCIELLIKYKVIPASVDTSTQWTTLYNLLPFKAQEYDSVKHPKVNVHL